jgi:hypothetical protein
MYWYRDGSALSLLPWLLAMLLAWLGGWLLATHAFRLTARERLIAGLGLGVVLYTWCANLIGHWLSPWWTFAGAALLVLIIGGLFALRRKDGPLLYKEDLAIWPWLIVGLGLIWLFLLWSKGVALFDEHKNLSLISVIANGDIPPRFFLDYPLNFIYHYGFQVFGASLMQLGGMLPWSAFDAGKAFLWGETLLLAMLLGRRYIGAAWGGWATAAVLALATGTRYLLLLLPPSILLAADKVVQLQGTSIFIGKPFSEALISGWTIDGGPPMQYMFGFLSGLMEPFVMAHQGPNILSIFILLLVWLLLPRLSTRWAALPLAAVLGMWALTWETTYALFIIGLFLFAAIYYWRQRNLALPDLKPVLWAALLSAPIALLQGGTLTEMARDLFFGIEQPGLLQLFGMKIVEAAGVGLSSFTFAPIASGILGFTLRWPPAILSSHLGALSIFSPLQLLVGLFEVGPVLLFTPWITRWAWRRAQAGDWPVGVLAVSAWVGFLIPLFLKYESDRDISRLSGQALLTWTLMLFFIVVDQSFRWRPILRQAAIVGLGAMLFGGMVITGTQFSALSTTQLGDGFNKLDSDIAAQMWGKLPADAVIFGPLGRSTILTGQLSEQLLDEPYEGSEWHDLFAVPNVQALRANGYNFLYIDSRWWDNLAPEVQAQSGIDDACVVLFAEAWDNSHVNYRRMLDLRSCAP